MIVIVFILNVVFFVSNHDELLVLTIIDSHTELGEKRARLYLRGGFEVKCLLVFSEEVFDTTCVLLVHLVSVHFINLILA